MSPDTSPDGWIIGVYPPYLVQLYDHFMADIGCMRDSRGCDITFFLGYQEPGKSIKSLGSWREVYDGFITRVIVDLSPLAGKQVQFILSVSNHGNASNANGFWFVPSVRSVQPTLPPTSTATATYTLPPSPTITTPPTATQKTLPTETSTVTHTPIPTTTPTPTLTPTITETVGLN
jgi:hypothetical protein